MEYRPWPWIVLALLIEGLAGLAGGLFSERWLARHQVTLISFAAGALLTVFFVDLLPEAIEVLGVGALSWAFAGFIALALIQGFGGHHPSHEASRLQPSGLLVADALHNISDGAAVAAAFVVSPRAGLGAALAIILHEVPQEVGDFALLRRAGFSRARALLSLALVQLTAAFGALGVFFAVRYFESIAGAALSIAAGTFLYIAATDLLPEVQSAYTAKERRERWVGFLLGVLLLLLVSAFSREGLFAA